MLRWRLSLGTLAIAALCGLCYWDYFATPAGIVLLPLSLLLILAGTQEAIKLSAEAGAPPMGKYCYAGNLLIWIGCAISMIQHPAESPAERLAWPTMALAFAFCLDFAGAMRRYVRGEKCIVPLAATVFIQMYVGMMMAFLTLLRAVGGARGGLIPLVSVIAVTKFADIGAYTFGRLFGRHKMAPRLSPGKTWEGAAGALVAADIAAAWSLRWLPQQVLEQPAQNSWGAILLFGALVGAAGMFGDLAESLLKREAGCKDSSTWMPGFGGVLDMIVSLLLAAPIVYFLWMAGVVKL